MKNTKERKMRSLLKSVAILGCLLIPANVSYAQIVEGDVISIDFGTTVSTATNWNTSVTGDTDGLIRLSDGTDTSVDLAITTIGGPLTNNNNAFVDGSDVGGSSDANIFSDGVILAGGGDDKITLTFTGLDDALSYSVFAGGRAGGPGFGANWTADGQTQDTNFQDTDPFVNFVGLSSTNGSLSVVLDDISDANNTSADGRNVGLSELTLTATAAVPEPSSLALLGFSFVGLLARRRR